MNLWIEIFSVLPPVLAKLYLGIKILPEMFLIKFYLKNKVNQDIILQAKSCDDYRRCKSQMDRPFGVIPLSPMKIYTGVPTNNQKIPDPLLIHGLVCTSGCPQCHGLANSCSFKSQYIRLEISS